MKRQKIELRQTQSEFLLYIHASQKERAKGIEGRRWDVSRKCWVYPKTSRVYDALISEFGDELCVMFPIENQQETNPPVKYAPEQEIKEEPISKQDNYNSHITEEDKGSPDAVSHNERVEIQKLKTYASSCEKEIEKLKSLLHKKETQLEKITLMHKLSNANVIRLQDENERLQVQISQQNENPVDLKQYFLAELFDIAKETALYNSQFVTLINKAQFGPFFSVEIR